MKVAQVHSAFASAFDQVFDVIVLGAGYVGWGAIRELSSGGKTVLLLEPSGQLLWESTQALRNDAGHEEGGLEWVEWLAGSGKPFRGSHFDVAAAEIEAAAFLAARHPQIRTLLYAMPVAVHGGAQGIHAITVATKGGFRPLRARRWIDASENGLLAALFSPENRSLRREASLTHGVFLQSLCWEKYEDRLAAFCRETGWEATPSARPTERGLRWRDTGMAWHAATADLLGRLRGRLGAGADVVVSQLSSRPFPAYAASRSAASLSVPENLLVLSPIFAAGSFSRPAARFQWGSVATRSWMAGGEEPPDFCGAEIAPPVPESVLRGKVVVVGTGTSGALAALAAGCQGADVLAVEFATFPGGVGTGAAISGYFHGVEGGLQVETDRLTAQMDLLLQGESPSPRRWHYESKKLALLKAFAEGNVRFLGGLLICGVEKTEDGHLTAILAASGDGLVRIEAPAFVDSTGDGDLCAFAGNDFQSGRSGDGRTLAYSQPALAIRPAEGRLAVYTENFDAGWVDPTDPEDLSRARLEGVMHYRGARQNLVAIAPLPGIRQSRQVLTDYRLTFSDLVAHRQFADSIGQAGSIADTHSIDFEFEDDEAVFFFLVCRLFRYPLRADLPYRMLLPERLENVWIACRAAGMENNASYAVRMQRDMQRLGEAAGAAAALAAADGGSSRGVKMDVLQGVLNGKNGHAPEPPVPGFSREEARRLLEMGRPGVHLWHLFQDRGVFSQIVRDALGAASPAASFYAASILAMWNDPAAEPRFLQAIREKESGPPPTKDSSGAHGQEIDIPSWLLAALLLRRCGTVRCLDGLRELANDPDSILNVRTVLATTLDRLSADGRIPAESAAELAELLVVHPLTDRLLAPSRSIWRTLRREQQLTLRNDSGIDVREDHSWQLHLIVCRIRSRLGLPIGDLAGRYQGDSRALVRRAFADFTS